MAAERCDRVAGFLAYTQRPQKQNLSAAEKCGCRDRAHSPYFRGQCCHRSRNYKAGNFQEAKAEFEKRLKSAPDSDKLNFAAGAASYKLGDFAKAVDHFTKALLSDDQRVREDATYASQILWCDAVRPPRQMSKKRPIGRTRFSTIRRL